MANVYFISETYFKDNTPVNINVESQLVNMSILDAQLLHIQTALGSILYKKLEALISSGDISDPANVNYKTLLDDYVQRATAMWALYEATTYIRYKLMNKGVQSQTSDNSTPVDLEELKYIQSKMMNSAEWYTQRIADYLLSNTTLFPEYTAAADIDDITPSSNAYFSGIVLDDCDECDRFLGLNSHTTDLNI